MEHPLSQHLNSLTEELLSTRGVSSPEQKDIRIATEQITETFLESLDAWSGKSDRPGQKELRDVFTKKVGTLVIGLLRDMERQGKELPNTDNIQSLNADILAPLQDAVAVIVARLNLDLANSKDLDILTTIVQKIPIAEHHNTKTVLTERFDNIMELLGDDEEAAREVVRAQPSLLTRNPETIKNNIDNIAKLLGDDEVAAREVVRAQPSLWGQNPETMKKKFQSLENAIPKSSEYTFQQFARMYPDVLWFSHLTIPKIVQKVLAGNLSPIEYVQLKNNISTIRMPLDLNRGVRGDETEETFLEETDIEKFWKIVKDSLGSPDYERLINALRGHTDVPTEILKKLAIIPNLKNFL